MTKKNLVFFFSFRCNSVKKFPPKNSTNPQTKQTRVDKKLGFTSELVYVTYITSKLHYIERVGLGFRV
jgi:hypothetical protein